MPCPPDGEFAPETGRQNSNVRFLPFYVRSNPKTYRYIRKVRQATFDPTRTALLDGDILCVPTFGLSAIQQRNKARASLLLHRIRTLFGGKVVDKLVDTRSCQP